MFLGIAKFRQKWPFIAFAALCVFIMDYMGVFIHLAELDYATSYQYPMVGDVKIFVQQVRKGVKPDVPPINIYNQTFISTVRHKCQPGEKLRLIYLVKSAAENAERRTAIRHSWGFERRFSDVGVRTVFFVGMVADQDVLTAVLRERETYNDIVQLDFIDSYFNNTVKTMNAMRWALQYCPNASFYFFSDDDMYLSTKNVLRFLRHPVEYPKYLEAPAEIDAARSDPKKWLSNIYNLELPVDVVLYAGRVMRAPPMRHKNSKWFISLDEYPYDMWPPYVTAGCYILSNEALSLVYYTSMYTKHFRFDDIYLSFVALKAGIEPFHSDAFHIYSKPSKDGYKYAIAVHDFDSPSEMAKVWNEQKAAGNA